MTGPIQLDRRTYRCKCGFEITGLHSKDVIVGKPDMAQWRSLCTGNAEEPYLNAGICGRLREELWQVQIALELQFGEGFHSPSRCGRFRCKKCRRRASAASASHIDASSTYHSRRSSLSAPSASLRHSFAFWRNS